MNKPEVGQIVYSLNMGNAARRSPRVLTEVTVTKVGRKYFTCGEGWQSIQYHLDTGTEKTEYSASSCIYESRQEYEDDRGQQDLYMQIKRHFSAFGNDTNISFDALRRIDTIIKEDGAIIT